MSSKKLMVETAIKMAAIAVILTSSFMLLMPMAINVSAQSLVTEVGAPGVKTNEYYVLTQELNADEKKLGVPVAVFTLTNIIVHKGRYCYYSFLQYCR